MGTSPVVEILLILVVLLAVIFRVYTDSRKPVHTPARFPIKALRTARLIYTDKPRSPVFRCQQHRLISKPDFLFETKGEGVIPVEYKSRDRGFYPSDEAQLISTVIALRAHYPRVNAGYVLLRSGQYQYHDLSVSTDQLLQRIARPLRHARRVTQGEKVVPVGISPAKCRGCSVKKGCDYAAV